MKIIILGNKEHGKDSIAKFIENAFGLKYASTSYFALEHFLFDEMIRSGEFSYNSVEEAYEDRDNYREYLFNAIYKFNTPTPSKLGEKLFSMYPTLCGIRHKVELEALVVKAEPDLIIWVDASKRKPLENKKSISVTREQANAVINNNDSLMAACREVWDLVIDRLKLSPTNSFKQAYLAV
ncbi:hypothetical protein V6259_12950 [Marinomonas sp. TI.3.20]|uniref:hypothetical protein n=1 Tax=Marinomonas sp. TI.3.20 TaxID=3121296 RepID=UPI00311E7CD3